MGNKDYYDVIVKEAYYEDAGRGIARLSIDAMKALQLVSGDVIEIQGKKLAFAVVWPSGSEDTRKSILRIDGSIRSNIGSGIDDKVRIKKADIGISLIKPYPFYYVSSPTKLFEYMACGLPVVANKGIPEQEKAILESKGGILVSFNKKEFTSAIIKLLRNKRLAKILGENGREWIRTKPNELILAVAHNEQRLGGNLCKTY
jgi:glycosyltransferase involved in cell wall biosynthesis